MVHNMNFACGLGIRYEASVLNKVPLNTTVPTGSRAPDVLIRGPGPNVPFRLQEGLIHAKQALGRFSSSWVITLRQPTLFPLFGIT